MPASIARTGVQTYRRADGTEVREYRSPEEVFSERSLASLAGVPLTIGHHGMLTPEAWRRLAVGHASDIAPRRRADGPHEWVDTDLVVSDADALARVDSGDIVELSGTYTADVIPRAGVSPEGEHYDAVQTNIMWNSIAMLETGRARAGRGARLRLDSKGDEMSQLRQDEGAPVQRRIKVDGIDCDYGSETHVQMLERRAELQTKRADDATTALTAAQAEVGTLKARLDAAPKPLDAVAVDKLVQDELSFRETLRPALPSDYVFAGKTREQVRLDAVGTDVAAKVKALPEAQREGYLLCAVQQRLDAADKPTHEPAPEATRKPREDGDGKPARYNPFKAFSDAHAASFTVGKA